jgi:hypothetical protein
MDRKFWILVRSPGAAVGQQANQGFRVAIRANRDGEARRGFQPLDQVGAAGGGMK